MYRPDNADDVAFMRLHSTAYIIPTQRASGTTHTHTRYYTYLNDPIPHSHFLCFVCVCVCAQITEATQSSGQQQQLSTHINAQRVDSSEFTSFFYYYYHYRRRTLSVGYTIFFTIHIIRDYYTTHTA